MTIRKFAAAVNNSWDYGLVGTELSDWCHSCPSSAAQLIERLRGESGARLKIINDKIAENDRLEAAAGMTRYWQDQYDLLRAQMERVRAALDSPVTRSAVGASPKP